MSLPQTKYGYPVAAPNTANLSLCSKAIGQKFDCLAVTLEMPFVRALGWAGLSH